jgi:hypothetical protein
MVRFEVLNMYRIGNNVISYLLCLSKSEISSLYSFFYCQVNQINDLAEIIKYYSRIMIFLF